VRRGCHYAAKIGWRLLTGKGFNCNRTSATNTLPWMCKEVIIRMLLRCIKPSIMFKLLLLLNLHESYFSLFLNFVFFFLFYYFYMGIFIVIFYYNFKILLFLQWMGRGYLLSLFLSIVDGSNLFTMTFNIGVRYLKKTL